MQKANRALLFSLMLLLVAMGLACDNGGNGGGGTGKTYSIADLTGKWNLREILKHLGPPYAVRKGVLAFNDQGNIILWQFPPGPPLGPPNSGAITVSPDGKITGAVTMFGNEVFKFDLHFQSDGSIKGRMYYIPVPWITQVHIWELTR